MKLYRELKENAKSPRDIFFDVDGVIADFEKGVHEYFDGRFSNLDSQELWNELEKTEHFFRNLPIIEDGVRLWEYVKQYEPIFLTASPSNVPNADQDKIDWLQENFDGYKDIILVNRSKEKAKYSQTYGMSNILIDDREVSIEPWIENGGIGIMYKNSEQTIENLKQFGY